MAGLPAKYIKQAKGDMAKAWRAFRRAKNVSKRKRAATNASKPKKKAPAKKKAAPKKKAPAAKKSAPKKSTKKTQKSTRRAATTTKKRGTTMARGARRKGTLQDKLVGTGLGMAGAIGANMASNLIPLPDPRLQAALPLVAGIAMIMGSGKNKMLEDLGFGMAIGGGLSTLKAVAPNIPFLAGDAMYDDDLPLLPQDVQQALLEGEVTPEEAEVLMEAAGLNGEPVDFAGEPLDFGGEDEDWQEIDGFSMDD